MTIEKLAMRGALCTLLVAGSLAAGGCSGGDKDGDEPGEGSSVGGSSVGGSNSAPGVVDLGNVGGNTGTGATGGGNGQPELCNGLDDDANGVIDDLDAAGDGVCDCLAIATLGIPGTWGQGDVFDTWLNARAAQGAVALGSQELTAELLAPLQVIVAQDLSENGRPYSEAEVAALQAWIGAGGGLITLIGFADPEERTNVNTLLAPFGVSYGAQPILAKNRNASTVPITGWAAHPTTANITLVGVDDGYPVEGAGTLIASEQGYDVAHALEIGAGKILIWGDEWITYNSEWVEHPDYQVERFWLNMLKWVTPAMECQVPLPPFEGPA